MNIVAWVLQELLAVVFLLHCLSFINPHSQAAVLVPIAQGSRQFIGLAEILAAAGLILPGVTRILPWLTPLAAGGLMIVTASACTYHLTQGETPQAIFVAILFVFVAMTTYLRWRSCRCADTPTRKERRIRRPANQPQAKPGPAPPQPGRDLPDCQRIFLC